MSTHFTWSIEAPGEKCPDCKYKTVLITAGHCWNSHKADDDGDDEDDDGYAEIREEVSGHWCKQCCKLVSLSLNT